MVDRNGVRASYDELGAAYARERTLDQREVAILRTFRSSLPEQARALDAGCGPGTPVLRTLTETATALGLDFSHAQLSEASEQAPTAALVQGDVTALPIRDDAVDAIVALHSLIHVPGADHRTVLDEFARVLSPSGRLLVSAGTQAWSGTDPDWLESGVEMEWHVAGAERTRERLGAAGFEIQDEHQAAIEFAGGDERWMYLSARLA